MYTLIAECVHEQHFGIHSSVKRAEHGRRQEARLAPSRCGSSPSRPLPRACASWRGGQLQRCRCTAGMQGDGSIQRQDGRGLEDMGAWSLEGSGGRRSLLVRAPSIARLGRPMPPMFNYRYRVPPSQRVAAFCATFRRPHLPIRGPSSHFSVLLGPHSALLVLHRVACMVLPCDPSRMVL